MPFDLNLDDVADPRNAKALAAGMPARLPPR